MKKLIAVLLVTIFAANLAQAAKPNYTSSKPVSDADWDTFLNAISQVETHGRTNVKVLDTNNKHSYGCLQIQNLYLKDSGLNYTLEDLYNKDIAFKVARAYLTRWGRAYERRTGKEATYEVLARIHNGGPRGYEKDATVKYWNKVKAVLDK